MGKLVLLSKMEFFFFKLLKIQFYQKSIKCKKKYLFDIRINPDAEIIYLPILTRFPFDIESEKMNFENKFLKIALFANRPDFSLQFQ